MEYLFGFWGVCAVAGGIIGAAKERGGVGFLLGLLLGPIGVLACFSLDGRQKCGNCGQRMDAAAKICPACGSRTALGGKITFDCTQCGKRITSHSSATGVHTCPRCKTLVAIPTDGPETDEPEAFELAPRLAIGGKGRLISCPDCGQSVSRRAQACPQCGCPIAGAGNS